jgi:hypothetical protein
MTTPRGDTGSPARAPNGAARWVGFVIMGIVVVAAAFVFLRQPRPAAPVAEPNAADTQAVIPPAPADSSAIRSSIARIAADTGERAAALALDIAPPTLSPADPFPDTLSLDADYRARQQRLCSERASADVSSGGQGTGASQVDHAGMAGDSLAFDGVARSSTGRAMVWRCTIGTQGYNVGRMWFHSADSVPGLVLQWNPVATLDDYVLRRCIVRAQSLYDDKKVLPRASGRRRDDHVRLVGVAEGNGISTNWNCSATVHGADIVTLDAHVGG